MAAPIRRRVHGGRHGNQQRRMMRPGNQEDSHMDARTTLHDLLDSINEWTITDYLENDEASAVAHRRVQKQHAHAAQVTAERDLPATGAIAHIRNLVETFAIREVPGGDCLAWHEAVCDAHEWLGDDFRHAVFVREDGAHDPEDGGYGRLYMRSLDGSLLPFEDFVKVNDQGFVSVRTTPLPKLGVVAEESSDAGRSTSA
jgi:hypothetical protein